MTHSGDYEHEMFRRDDLDEATTERLLSRQPVEGFDAVVAFVEDASSVAAGSAPAPSSQLAALFAEGTSVLEGAAPAARPIRRKRMLEVAVAKLASAALLAKVGVATAAATAAASAAAFTGNLPSAAQDQVADLAEKVNIELPGGSADAGRQDADHRRDGTRGEDVSAEDGAEPSDTHGSDVSTVAEGGPERGETGASETGRDFGTTVATTAGGQAPAERPTAESNPGTEYREDAPAPDQADSRAGDAATTGDAGEEGSESPPAGAGEQGDAYRSSATEDTPAAGRP